MARFYAEIQGNRGMAARQGFEKSGIWSHTRGWDIGVQVDGYVDEDGNDCFDVWQTTGSNGFGSKELITTIKKENKNDNK